MELHHDLSTPTTLSNIANKDHLNSNHLLHRLYDIQNQFQHIPKQRISTLAEELKLPVSQI